MRAILRDAATRQWRLFERPVELVVAFQLSEVIPALERIERATAEGLHAAGFIAYEAAPAFDAALRCRGDDTFPLLWFGLYGGFQVLPDDALEIVSPPDSTTEWAASIDAEQYRDAFIQLQHLIRAGDTYQVNFTYRLTAPMPSSPWEFFRHLVAAQQPPYGAYIHAGEWIVCSASPELFFERYRAGDSDAPWTITSRPMKGTAPRGLSSAQDLEQRQRLHASSKDRAENVMIVDMVRNDLGRIAQPGSVRVTALFETERYPTLWQMTSTVRADSDAGIVDVMRALFPAASITGAPKASTMSIIAGIETSPRRIYTGTVGLIDPGGRAQFNVAIRTALINRKTTMAEYGVGGGIVADSNVEQELVESRLKSKVLLTGSPDFELLETMAWRRAEGYVLLDAHLQRLSASADYFGFSVDLDDVRRQLLALEATLPDTAQRIRLLLSKRGVVDLRASPLIQPPHFDDIVLAVEAIDRDDPFLYHKTTNRRVYDAALAARPEAADVLLFNSSNEVTESTIANVVAEIDGKLVTPPVACGLLPGTARDDLLRRGVVREQIIRLDDLPRVTRLLLVNSLRGMQRVQVRSLARL